MTALAPVIAATMAAHGAWAVAVDRDGLVRTGGSGAPPWLAGQTVPARGQLAALGVTADGVLRIAWAADKRIELDELAGGAPRKRFFEVPAPIQAVALSPSADVVALACCDGTIRGLDLRTGELGWEVAVGPGTARAVAVASDAGPVAAALAEGSLRHCEVRGGKSDLLVLPFPDRPAMISVANGSVVAAGPDGLLIRWRPNSGTPLEFRDTGIAATALAVDRDGDKALIGTADGRLWLYDFAGDRKAEFGAAEPEPATRAAPVMAAARPPAGTGRITDDDVRFTVYRPRALPPGDWARLLVFAHKTTLVEQPGQAPLDPNKQVELIAQAVFGGVAPPPVAIDSQAGVFRGARLRIVPELPGIYCNPADAEFDWWEPVHQAEFRLFAGPALAGSVVRGAVHVFCGPLLIGEVSLAVSIASGPAAGSPAPLAADWAIRPRKIFASYSHDDREIVDGFADVIWAIGDQYLQDVLTLRSGERWRPRLRELIEEADVFQLFWSRNSMRSRHCQDEWEHALSLRRPSFVKPLYWEHPLPSDPVRGLPSPALRELHFVRVRPYQRRTTPPGTRGADTGAWSAPDGGAQPYGPPPGYSPQELSSPRGLPRDPTPPGGNWVSPPSGAAGPATPYPGDPRPGPGGYGSPPGTLGPPAGHSGPAARPAWGAPAPPARSRARRTALTIVALTLVAVIVGVVLAVIYG